ncbi:MAG: hypothetical protein IT422_28740 [Pirellulaceae bacterium]|nr:hypothetical protein [Pirellulaceae bacterium]
MGLDTVELVMDIEEAFDISIPDDRASQMLTVGDVYEFILEKTNDSTLSSKTCLTAATFYELRTILLSAGIKNTDIRPRTRIDRVFPLLGRRSNWKTLSSKMGLRFPRLERPSWLTLVNCMVVAALVFGTFLTFAKPKVSDGIAMASVAGTIGSFTLYLLTIPFAVLPGSTCLTIRDLVTRLVAINFNTLSRRYSVLNPTDIWNALQLIVSEQLGVAKSAVVPTARFVQDLGAE